MRFYFTHGDDNHFIKLCNMLDSYLNKLAGGQKNRQAYVPLNATDDIDNALVVYHLGRPVACGAFKRYNSATAELKRMFVKKKYRRKGLAEAIVILLELNAEDHGFKTMVVETGRDMPAAVRLYQKSGYTEVDSYGAYAKMQNSVCMQKTLDKTKAT